MCELLGFVVKMCVTVYLVTFFVRELLRLLCQLLG